MTTTATLGETQLGLGVMMSAYLAAIVIAIYQGDDNRLIDVCIQAGFAFFLLFLYYHLG